MQLEVNSSSVCTLDVPAYIAEMIQRVVNTSGMDSHFFVIDLNDIVRKYREWQQKMPRVEPFYAMKCNDTPGVLRLIADLGVNFDCASKKEMSTVLDLGVSPERVIFASPCKIASHVKYAAEHDVAMTTFDNEHELYKIKRLHPGAKLVIRITTDDSKAQCPLSIKFGAKLADTRRLLTIARQLELNVIGVSFHVGSGSSDASAWSVAIRDAKRVFEEADEVGYAFSLLDIGGGYPGDRNASIDFDDICNEVNASLDEHFPEGCGVRLIAEPGRYMVASAFTLVVNVHSKDVDVTWNKETGTKTVKNKLYVNDGIYGSFNCLMFDHARVFPALFKADMGKPVYHTSVWGPSCDGLDCILKDVLLPDLDIGSWLIFENMGAYTVAAASCFNGFPKPINYYIEPTEEKQGGHDLGEMREGHDLGEMRAGHGIGEVIPCNVVPAVHCRVGIMPSA
ncbi:PREDICTED: antizyme inhibitor 2-like [Priapulus caudatus]|uniref:ornithine decarboxylase n=1 Tax=Priapulus caudatus TaxID=37621 RepID=A0ABM1FBQ2_PRICU|nr:PREDICTED: antizyme inhibitor 2-like [Priapulus caudatus]